MVNTLKDIATIQCFDAALKPMRCRMGMDSGGARLNLLKRHSVFVFVFVFVFGLDFGGLRLGT